MKYKYDKWSHSQQNPLVLKLIYGSTIKMHLVEQFKLAEQSIT